MALQQPWTATVTPDDKLFYQALGKRLAQWRKAHNLTQQQLADRLGISQQTLAHYEVGRLRVAVSMLTTVADELQVPIEALIHDEQPASGKRGPASRLEQQIARISQLPRTKQRFVMEMLDTVLHGATD